MKQHIQHFPAYLAQGYAIAQETILPQLDTINVARLLLVGMGGSGMAGEIIKTLIDRSENGIPTYVINEYKVPERTDAKTLMIVASYSGNTEETVSAMHDGLKKGAQMIAITSGGELMKFAQEHQQRVVIMPSGIEPRAALPYSLSIQLAIADKLGLISYEILQTIRWLAERSQDNQAEIQKTTHHLAEKIFQSFPLIYACPEHTGLAIRFRQQLNENSRMLCGHHIIPEMNHNELLGRQEGNLHVSTVFITSSTLTERNQLRYTLTKQVITDRGSLCFDLHLAGNTLLQQLLSGIYLIDRVSYHTAMKRGVDPSGMEIIERLKGELKKHG